MATGPTLVSREFEDNAPKVEQEAVQALLKLRERIVRANDIDKVFGGVGEVDLAHLGDHVPS
jgi:hypothetical protein